MPLILSGTSGLSGVDGSVSTPALQGSDTNTGVYFPAADTVAIAAGGTEAFRATSGGNLSLTGTMAMGSSFLRNRIINGAMVIDQRNAGASVAADALFPVDRWTQFMTGGGVLTSNRSTTVPSGFTNSLLMTATTADASIAAGDVYFLQQKIEGFNVGDLGFGTASAQPVTISFYVRSSITGTYAVSLANSAANRGYVATYTISSANTWEYKTVTIAGDTTGTWLTDSGIGLRVSFDLGSGSTYNGTAGAWGAAQVLRTSGTVNWISTLNATFYITGVQLEAGSVATPFERRLYGQELALCQRYYLKMLPSGSGEALGVGVCNSTTSMIVVNYFPVQMRTRPTTVETSGTAADYAVFVSAATNCNAVPSFGTALLTSARTTFGVAAGLTVGQAALGWTNNVNAYLAWSAEL